MKHKNNDLRGFTIVEVVLVLAVAGLIFGMVFVAFPALRASAKDTDRRADVLEFIGNLKKFQTNNSRGALPGSADENKKLTKNGYLAIISGTSAVSARSQSEAEKKKNDLAWLGFYRDYFNQDFQDPDGVPYNLAVMLCKQTSIGQQCDQNVGPTPLKLLYNNSFADNKYTIRIVESAVCSGDKAVLSANQRRVAVLYKLERGIYCENS